MQLLANISSIFGSRGLPVRAPHGLPELTGPLRRDRPGEHQAAKMMACPAADKRQRNGHVLVAIAYRDHPLTGGEFLFPRQRNQ
jgi:hypothetical protein